MAERRRAPSAVAVGALRGGNWWYSKLPPLFGVAFVQIALLDLDPGRAMLYLLGVLIVTGGAVGAWGHVLNDAYDIAADRRAGRTNRMARLAPAVRATIAGALLVTALVPAVVIGYGPIATVLLALEVLLPALYSIPPVRLKERGLAGVAADAAAAHALPALIVMTAFAHAAGSGVDSLALLVLVGLWSALLGLDGILWHQRLDRASDLRAGARTFATGAAPATLERVLRGVYVAEVVSFLALVAVLAPALPLLATTVAACVGLDLVRLALGWSWLPDPQRPELARRHLPLVSNACYEVWFPLAGALELALRKPAFVVLPLLLATLFWRNLREQAADLAALGRDLVSRLPRRPPQRQGAPQRGGWSLEVFEGAAARLASCPARESGLRVEIADPGRECWHVKLSRGPLTLRRGAAAELRAEMRADAPRPVTWCTVRRQAPWDSLGLSEGLEIPTGWCTVRLGFAASEDADADLCLLLGDAAAAVELGEVVVAALDQLGGEDSA